MTLSRKQIIASTLALAAVAGLALSPHLLGSRVASAVDILASADVKERIKTLGYDLIASTPEEFGAQVQHDVARWSEVVRRANVPMN